ncbi:glycosyltransferase family 117 protein [Pedobacter sp. GSP4]|uniref:glycosyltransferase family 117 protein n=1 Tax=Pedobacter sp. GSP4 TaxID=3453716 RepID=UPI003EEDA786
MNYSRINTIGGWLCFTIAALIYILTLDQSVSFWDCGEFIASAFRMEVVHQPGAPMVSMIQRLFSTLAFGDKTKIAYFMNLASALASAGTILFLFWTITALAKKTVVKKGEEITRQKTIGIIGAGLVGALAYAFSDSFWFSAVEAEVYAMSSLCTAIVFWGILKWESQADEPKSDRWLLFVAYIMGISIGVHILNLLSIPALIFVYYFKKYPSPNWQSVLKVFCISIGVLAVVQFGIIQYLVALAANFDYFFVNSMGLGFGTGVLFFAILVIGGLVYGIRYSIRKNKRALNLAVLFTVLLLFGYSSFALLIIRAQAKPNLNNTDPENAFNFLSYVNRAQYGDRPLLYGENYNSEKIDIKETGKLYRKGKTRYESAGTKSDYVFSDKTLAPRMYSDKPEHVRFYKNYMGFDDSHKPTLMDNLKYMFSFQTGQMYMRYFMWNFVGRQDNEDGQFGGKDGNWLSGIKPIDAVRLGDQKNLPPSIVENKAYNRFFFLPLIIGLIGAIWHFKRNQKDAGIIGLLFVFTGIAIVVYLNSVPIEPRERDYAYVGSFYAFAIWIGLGVFGLKEWLFQRLTPARASIFASVIALLGAPVIMANQGWDDHDRSDSHVAHDMSVNYLKSCAPNAILFTYGDNDTYPVWYAQEVENIRPDVRVVNLSLFTADWYIDGMKRKQNQSEPLPLSITSEQYVAGTRDIMYYQDYKIAQHIELKEILDVLLSDHDEDKVTMSDGSKYNVLPTKNLKLAVNPQQVLDTGTVPKEDAGKIASSMEWVYNSNYVTKGTLALFDILTHNNWERPIYFTGAMPDEQYIGLNKYLYSEGLNKRLLPLKPDTASTEDFDRINIKPLYHNLMNVYGFGNIKNANHLDRQSADDVTMFSNMFNGLLNGLINQGKIAEGKSVADKYFEVIPSKFYSMRQVMSTYYFTESLYRLNDLNRANAMIRKTADYVGKELNHLAAVSESKNQLSAEQDVRFYLGYLGQMVKLTEVFKQDVLSKNLEKQYNDLIARFTPFATG